MDDNIPLEGPLTGWQRKKRSIPEAPDDRLLERTKSVPDLGFAKASIRPAISRVGSTPKIQLGGLRTSRDLPLPSSNYKNKEQIVSVSPREITIITEEERERAESAPESGYGGHSPTSLNSSGEAEELPIQLVQGKQSFAASWANLKREERLRNLRRFSTSFPVSTSPNSSGDEDNGKGKLGNLGRGWTKRLSKVWSTISSHNSAKEYSDQLKSGKELPLELFLAIREKLERASLKWVFKFIEDGGLEGLMTTLHLEMKCSNEEVIVKRKEILICIGLIIAREEVPLKDVLKVKDKDSDTLNKMILFLNNKEYQTVIIDILNRIAERHGGYSFVLSALEYYKNVFKKKSKFEDILSYLDQEQEAMHAAECLALFNQMLNNMEELSQRFLLHHELLGLGLLNMLVKLRKMDVEELQVQLDAFEEAMIDDHDDIIRENVGFELTKGTGSTETQNPNRLRILVSLARHTVTYTVPYNETTRTRDVHTTIKAKYPTMDFSEYGLVFAFSVWLEEDKLLMSEYGFIGEEVLEYKMNPWSLLVRETATGKEIKLNIDPMTACAEVIHNLMSKFKPKSDEDYGLFVRNKDEPDKGEWLEDTKVLSIYRDIRDKVLLEFKIKPKLITVKFQDNTTDTLLVDLDNLVSKFLDMIAKKRDIAAISDYSLTLEGTETVLRPEQKLNACGVGEGSVLKLAIKLQPLVVVLPSGSEEAFRVYWTQKASDLIIEICEKLKLDPNAHYLVRADDANKGVSLFPWSSLKDLNIPYASKLFLKQKKEKDSTETEGNIWDEAKKMTTNQKTNGYTLHGLVIQLSTEKDYDVTFLKTFLWTYESFTTPEILIKKLIERFRVPPEIPDHEKKLIQMRVCTVLKHWIEHQYHDLGEVMATIVNFIETEMTQKELEGIVGRLKKAITTKKNVDVQQYHYSEDPPEPLLPKSDHPNLFDIDPLEIARQITLPLFEIFAKIKPTELFNSAWLSPKLQHRSPNVLKMIERFNYVGNWVTTSIVNEPKLKNRVKAFINHIRLAQAFLQLQNYHLLVAVISGLNNSAVLRLKWTKSKIGKRYEQLLEQLESLCSMEGSWKSIRSAITMAIPPRIPYLGIYLMDLIFIDEGNPDIVDNNLINFEKRKLVFSILSKIEESQKIGYNFKPVPSIEKLLSNLIQQDDKEQYKKSLECEPRNCTKKDLI